MYIYILITRTPTVVGKVIRQVLDNKYNHMSIATEEDLSAIYSFGRISVKNFIVGGPMHESYYTLSIGQNKDVQLCVFKIPVTRRQYECLMYFINNVFYDKEGYVYNFADAIGMVFNKRIKIKKCYTCIEFCQNALNFAGIRIASILQNCNTLDDARKKLKHYMIYEGRYRAYPNVYLNMTDSDRKFMEKRGFYTELRHTARSFKKFIGRAYKRNS